MLKKLYVEDVLKMPEGSEVELLGWIRNKRVHGGLIFLDLRDRSGVIQVAVKRGVVPDGEFEQAESALRESAVKVSGIVKHDPRAPNGVEIRCRRLEVIGPSLDDFPIRKGVKVKFVLDHRHLHIRSPRVAAIMKVRARLLKAARNWLESQGFVEVNCPSFITAAVEGGATLFEVDYFGRKAYLTQSSQFYQEAAIYSLEKVYSLQPSFRAELSRTRRHLTEFWGIDVEIAFSTYLDAMEVLEGLVTHVFRSLTERRKEELELLGVKLKVPNTPFKRITYDEALEIARGKGKQVEWGFDIPEAAERAICEEFKEPFFVVDYPVTTRAFYYMPNPENPELTLSFDLFSPGKRGVELASGGQRIHDFNLLLKRIEDKGLVPERYSWYLEMFKYGVPPHAGFGLGVERLVYAVTNVRNVQETILFPRTPERLVP